MSEFQELITEVPKWNLYTDEKLVSRLDSFLNNMMTQCEIIHKNFEQTMYDTNAVSIYLSDTFNAFSNLSNKQFIENAVAPVEEPQIVPKEVKHRQEMTVEKKQENFQKAVKDIIDVFGIASTDDEETVTKSDTMSMSSMPQAGTRLPFIIGSKAFAQDEFLGIIDSNESRGKRLADSNREALGSNPASVSDAIGQQQAPNDSSHGFNDTPNSNSQFALSSAPEFLPPITVATNRVEIQNSTLGPPPPLQQIFADYEASKQVGVLISKGSNRPSNPAGSKFSMNFQALKQENSSHGLFESGNSDRDNEVIGRAGIKNKDDFSNPLDPVLLLTPFEPKSKQGKATVQRDEQNSTLGPPPPLQQIFANYEASRPSLERYDIDMNFRRPLPKRSPGLFESDNSDADNNEVIERPDTKKKVDFSSLFDPLMFMPFEPKSQQAKAAAQRDEEQKRDKQTRFYDIEEEKEASGNNKLNKILEDSDDEETKFIRQKLLNKQYGTSVKYENDVEEASFVAKDFMKKEALVPKPQLASKGENSFPSEPIEVISEPKKQGKAIHLLFKDENEDDDISRLRDSKQKTEPKMRVTASGKSQKKKLFDSDEDIDSTKVGQHSMRPSGKKSLFEVDKEAIPELIKEELEPVMREGPKHVLKEEFKSNVRPLAPEVIGIEESWNSAPKVGGGSNLTQLIKAAHLAKRKKSSDEDSDSDGPERAPVAEKKNVEPTMSVLDANNPVTLLEGLKKIDDEKKSEKAKATEKRKGLFGDDEDEADWLPNLRVAETRPSAKVGQRMTLFSDSDEDAKKLEKKSITKTLKVQAKSKLKGKLFVDSD